MVELTQEQKEKIENLREEFEKKLKFEKKNNVKYLKMQF